MLKFLRTFALTALMVMPFAAQAQTLNEGFEGTWLPDDWTTIHVSGSVSWERYTSYQHAGTACAWANYAYPGHENYLVTPKLVPAAGESLSFWVAGQNYGGTTLTVEVSTTTNTADAFTTVLATYESGSGGTLGSTSLDNFVEKIIDLSDYVGQNIYVAFHVEDDNGDRICIDDVSGVTLFVPSCARVTDLAATAIGTNSISLAWTDANNSGASYSVYQGTTLLASGIAGLGIPGSAINGSYTVNGLEPNTDYTFSVVANCTGDETSDPTNITVRTACGLLSTLPYTCGFESSENVVLGNYPFPACWSKISEGVYPYSYNYSYFSRTGSYILAFSGSGEYAVLPHIDVATLPIETLRLRFWTRLGYTSGGALEVGTMSDPTDPSTFTAVKAITVTSSYVEQDILELAATTDEYIAIRSTGTATVYVDDLTLEAKPSCVMVSDLKLASATNNSVTLEWADVNNTGATYSIVDVNNEEVATGIAGTTYTITGLEANTAYTYKVVANCSAEEASDTVLVTVYTECDPVATVPYTWDFEEMTSEAVPECWKKAGEGNAVVKSSSNNAHASSKYLDFRGSLNNVIVLPATAVEANTLQLKFWIRPESNNSNCGTFSVGYVTNPMDASTFVALKTFSHSEFVSGSSVTYGERAVMFETAPAGARMAMRADPVTNYYWYIDDVTIDELPSCVPVSNLAADATTTSVNLTWGSNASSFTILDMADNSILGTSTTPTFEVSGLEANTEYTFGIYVNCDGEESDTVTVTFLTECALISTLPYTCDFDGDVVNAATQMPFCWTRGNSGTYPNCYNSASYARSGSNSLFFSSNSSSLQVAVLPHIDVATLPLNTLRLKFFGRSNSSTKSNDIIVGTISDPTDATTFTAVDTVTVSGNAHSMYVVKGFPVNTDEYIAFMYATPTNSLYLDDLTLELLPTCLDVTGLTTGEITTTSVELLWEDEENTGATYTVLNGTEEVATGITETTYTVTGLTANTTYTFSVVANCSATDASPAVTINVHTSCGAVDLPLAESFDTISSTTINCWELVSMNTANVGGTNGMQFITSGDNLALRFSSWSSASDYTQYAFSPVLNAPDSVLGVTVEYSTRGSSDRLYFGYTDSESIDPDDYTWTAQYTTSNENTHNNYFALLPAGTKRFAIKYYPTGSQYYAWVHEAEIKVMPVHEVTVDVNDATMGSTEPTGTVEAVETTEVSLSATANDSYRFVAWLSGEDTVSFSETLTLTVMSDTNLTAHFEAIPTYIVTLMADAAMGTTTPDAGDSIVREGNEMAFTATANEGYRFVAWVSGEDTLSLVDSYSLTVMSDTVITAVFERIQVTVTLASADATQGTVEPEGDSIVFYGDALVATATEAEGYHFTGWVSGEDTVSTENPLTITAVSDSTLTAAFAINTYTVSLATADATMGNVEPENDSIVEHGTEFTATATELEGYHFAAWMSGDDTISTENPFTFTVVSDSALTAVFAINTYTVTLATADAAMGTVEPTGDTVVEHGNDLAVEATAEEGSYFVAWLSGEDTVSYENPVTLTIVSDSTLTAHFAYYQYTVTAVADPVEGGSITGVPEEAVNYGTVVSLTAVPAEGYHFTGWSNGETEATISVTVVRDTTLTAAFEANDEGTFSVTVVYDATMGTVEGIPTEPVAADSVVTLVAVAAEGYHFTGWDNGVETDTLRIAVERDTVVTATFAINTYTFTAEVETAETGTITGVPTEAVEHGTTITLTAVAAEGYHFTGWSNGETTETIDVVVVSDTALTASFEINLYSVQVDIVGDGSITGTYSDETEHGTEITLTAVPSAGYHFVGWSTGETDFTLVFTVVKDTVITATFEANAAGTYTVAVDFDGAAGNVTGIPTEGVAADSEIELTATANDGFRFIAWVASDDTIATTETLTLTVVSDTALVAVFEAIPVYTVSVLFDETMGSVAMDDTLVREGNDFTATATELLGYRFLGWVSGNDTIEVNATITLTVMSDTTIEAVFEAVYQTITLAVNDEAMGTVSPMGDTLVQLGTEFSAVATANDGYRFLGWVSGTDTVSTLDTMTFTVMSDSTLTAVFELIPVAYTITLNVNDAVMGTVSAGATLYGGEEFTATATANYGYRFLHWRDAAGTTVSTANPYTFTVESDLTLTAVFGIDSSAVYTLTGEANNAAWGVVYGSGTYTYGTTVRLIAQAAEGYRFERWSDGTTLPYIDVTVVSDTTVTAIFVEGTVGIDETEATEAEIVCEGSRIIVRGAQGSEVNVYDVNGRRMNREVNAGETVEFNMQSSGVYLVKVGTAPAKRVVVVR